MVRSTQKNFKLGSEFYQQVEGLPMGSPLTPLLAEIFMGHFENTLFKVTIYNNLSLLAKLRL
jgi:hypothetical protein